jgi:ABC-2 type transport system permease protein
VIRTISSEWIKISTVLAHKILVIAAIAFPLVIITLASTFGDVETGPDSVEMAEFVLGLCVVSAMLLGVVAVIGLTSEYTHNTIRPTYAATPRRSRVIASKWLVSSLITVVVAVFTVFGAWFVASTIFNSRGGDTSVGDDAVVTVLVSTVVLALLVTWFGFGLGLIIRNSPATVSILLLWPLLIEGLLRVVFGLIGWDGLSDWLPYQAAIEAAGGNVGDESLGRPMVQIWFGVVGLAVIAVGMIVDHRRDA